MADPPTPRSIYDPGLSSSLSRRDWERVQRGVFSCANAWNLLIASFIAYAPKTVAEQALEEHGLKGTFTWIENGNDVAYVASDGKHAIVCARGSDDPLDWWENLHVGLVDDTMGKVHGGITNAIGRLWDGLNGAGLELAEQAEHIWLTGHSRGALIMTLVAARWRDAGVEIDGLYTFGSPRIGDADFQANLQKSMIGSIHRVQNEGDWMSEMPPSPPYEHVHVGELTEVNAPADGGEDHRTPEEKEGRLKQLLRGGLDGARERILGRHLPQAYISALRAYCDPD